MSLLPFLTFISARYSLTGNIQTDRSLVFTVDDPPSQLRDERVEVEGEDDDVDDVEEEEEDGDVTVPSTIVTPI